MTHEMHIRAMGEPVVRKFAHCALACAVSGVCFLAPLEAHAVQPEESVHPEGSAPPASASAYSTDVSAGLWGRPVRRGGFHFQATLGVGGGADTRGIFHAMEIGYTFERTTVAMLHTFIQNRGVFGGTYGGPDLIGGWMLEVKYPLFFPDLVGKVALGLGGIHDQSVEPLKAYGGFGASYGVDLHFPIWQRFGPTLTIAALHATALGEHHFGAGTALGFTLF